jgi:hypothetical protein
MLGQTAAPGISLLRIAHAIKCDQIRGCDLSRKALVSAAQPSAEKSSVNFLLFTGRLETALPMVVRKIYPTAHFDLTQSFRFGTG